MKLQEFINYLQEIKKNNGDNVEVVMADGISVVEPVFFEDYNGERRVVFSDER